MKSGPLTHDLAVGTGVFQFVRGDAGEVVGGDVAYAVAAGLYGVHLDPSQVRQDVRHGLQLRPVELDVLAGAEMAVALVVPFRDVSQHAQLLGGQDAIRNRHPQHGGVALQVQAVHQAQGPELVGAELARQEPPGLVAKLRHPLVHEALVVLIVLVHGLSAGLRVVAWPAKIAGVSYVEKRLISLNI